MGWGSGSPAGSNQSKAVLIERGVKTDHVLLTSEQLPLWGHHHEMLPIVWIVLTALSS